MNLRNRLRFFSKSPRTEMRPWTTEMPARKF